ncbi:MAG TPA: hypothetical protein PLQ52_04810 [Lacunisphaera sp.]|jgi:hypothetical protein|nr:hypothetical protein [Lacunisphaera sp.]HQY05365.1 hypothetical protein [Lacunisphaera sp.]
MSRRGFEILHRWRGPVAGASLVLAPKCLLCLAAYSGAGVALGLGGPEICGATTAARGHPAAWPVLLGAASLAAPLGRFIAARAIPGRP